MFSNTRASWMSSESTIKQRIKIPEELCFQIPQAHILEQFQIYQAFQEYKKSMKVSLVCKTELLLEISLLIYYQVISLVNTKKVTVRFLETQHHTTKSWRGRKELNSKLRRMITTWKWTKQTLFDELSRSWITIQSTASSSTIKKW